MILDRWRAQRAIRTRSAPSTVDDTADPALFAAVEGLKPRLECDESLGDPHWHYRWQGAYQLVGLDASTRSVSDVRQRLARLVHELDLSHLPRRMRRVVAVVLVAPEEGEDLRGWHARLDHDQGEVGSSDWRAARRRVALVALRPDGSHRLFGGDRATARAVEAWGADHA